MFAPPERLQAEVFARIPERFHVTGRVEPWLERARLERFKGCDDLFFASNGDL